MLIFWNKYWKPKASLSLLVLLCAGCTAGPNASANLAHGTAAYGVIPAAAPTAGSADYRIGPLDSIDITVFQEPELSAKALQVDAAGNIAVPLVGPVPAAGKTAPELAKDLEARFDQQYLKNSQITVAVSSSVSQKVVVQGQVTLPGVYEIKGPTTLLEAVAMAKGETRIARLEEVVVFRTIKGQRMGAVFDLASIRRGDAQDPEIVGNDVVIVGYSSSKSLWRDILSATPVLNVFRPLAF